MATSFFRQGILRRSWDLLWSNKALWFFGLFAAVLAIGEEYDLFVRNSDVLSAIPSQLNSLRDLSQNGAFHGLWQDIVTMLRNYLPETLGFFILPWTLIVLSIIWIVIVSQAALIEGVRQNEEGGKLSLLGGFDRGMANFWPILALNIVVKVFVYGLLFIVVGPLAIAYIAHPSEALLLAITLWSFLVLIPVITVAAFVMKFATAYVVIKKYPLRQAIGAGWIMFTKNWLVTVELAMIIIVMNLAVTLTTTYTLFGIFNFPNTSNLGYLVMFAIFALIFSWLTVFQYGAWINLFFRINEGHASSKLQRIINYILGLDEQPTRATAVRARK